MRDLKDLINKLKPLKPLDFDINKSKTNWATNCDLSGVIWQTMHHQSDFTPKLIWQKVSAIFPTSTIRAWRLISVQSSGCNFSSDVIPHRPCRFFKLVFLLSVRDPLHEDQSAVKTWKNKQDSWGWYFPLGSREGVKNTTEPVHEFTMEPYVCFISLVSWPKSLI